MAPLCGQGNDPLGTYVSFLDGRRTDTVDYVVGLFEDHDLVVTETASYEGVFDGSVFYRHLPEHRMVEGVPGLVDEAYLPELRRRFRVVGREISSVELSEIAGLRLDTSRYDALDDLERGIRGWLVPDRQRSRSRCNPRIQASSAAESDMSPS